MSGRYFAEHAPSLARHGYLVVQVYPGQKRPRGDAWQQQRSTAEDVERIAQGFAGDNVGILTGVGDNPVCLVDIDCQDAQAVAELRAWCDKELGLGVERVGAAPKLGLVYRVSPGLTKVSSPVYQDSEGRKAQLEVMLSGQQFVAWGLHPDGHEYAQPGLTTLDDTPVGELPLVGEDQLMTLLARFNDMAEARGWAESGRARRPRTLDGQAVRVQGDDDIPDPPTDLTEEQVRELISHFSCEAYDDWNSMGLALHHQFGGEQLGLDIWDDWSQAGSTYPGLDALAEKWASYGLSGRRAITLRTYIAERRRQQEVEVAEAMAQARAEAEQAIQGSEDLRDLLGPVAQRAGQVVAEYPILGPVLEQAIQARYRAQGLGNGARIPVGQVRAAMRPRGGAGGGAVAHLLTEAQRRAIQALRLTSDEDNGRYHATLSNVQQALASAAACGVELAYDAFLGDNVLRPAGETLWRPIKDADLVGLRMLLENGGRPGGFHPIGRELMRDVVMLVCEQNQRHAAREWATGLPEWDGVPRIERFLAVYAGAEDGAYTRAVSMYMWTALAGRTMAPGCQADMVPVLIGDQGAGKTSLVRNLVALESWYGEVHLGKKDEDNARLIRGKQVCELGELKGLRSREIEDQKAFITRRTDEWTPKYREMNVLYQRSCLFIGTANDPEFLEDHTGNRRWLPVVVGTANLAALARDLEQLWAEAIVAWGLTGIQWQDAERLARDVHGAHMVFDDWQELIVRWLEGSDDLEDPDSGPKRYEAEDGIGLLEVASGALGLSNGSVNRVTQVRIGKILAGLGYAKRQVREGTARHKRWFPPGHWRLATHPAEAWREAMFKRHGDNLEE